MAKKLAYKLLDIALLSVRPEFRCTAISLQSQMPHPGLIEYARFVFGGAKAMVTAIRNKVK